MPDEETIARYRLRAAELRALAAKAENQFRRDWLIAAAESYEKLAAWEPPEPIKRE